MPLILYYLIQEVLEEEVRAGGKMLNRLRFSMLYTSYIGIFSLRNFSLCSSVWNQTTDVYSGLVANLAFEQSARKVSFGAFTTDGLLHRTSCRTAASHVNSSQHLTNVRNVHLVKEVRYPLSQICHHFFVCVFLWCWRLNAGPCRWWASTVLWATPPSQFWVFCILNFYNPSLVDVSSFILSSVCFVLHIQWRL